MKYCALVLALLCLSAGISASASSSDISVAGDILASQPLFPDDDIMMSKTPLDFVSSPVTYDSTQEKYTTGTLSSPSEGVYVTGIKTIGQAYYLMSVTLSWSDGTTSTIGTPICTICPYIAITQVLFQEVNWSTETTFASVTYNYGTLSGASGYLVYSMTLTDTSGNTYEVFTLDYLKNQSGGQTSKTVSLGGSKLYGTKVGYYSNESVYGSLMYQFSWTFAANLGAMDFWDVTLDLDSAYSVVTGVTGYQSGTVDNCVGSESSTETPSFSYQTSTQESYTSSTSVSNSYSSTDENSSSISVKVSTGVEIEGVFSSTVEVGAENEFSYSETTSQSNSYTYGNTDSQTTTTTVSNTGAITAAAGHQVKWEFYVYEVSVTVPYSGKVTLTYSNGETDTQSVSSSYTLAQQYASTLMITSDTTC
eukprot:Nk52_evm11s1892 gene=Nk52_evmTU11s1892